MNYNTYRESYVESNYLDVLILTFRIFWESSMYEFVGVQCPLIVTRSSITAGHHQLPFHFVRSESVEFSKIFFLLEVSVEFRQIRRTKKGWIK